MATVQHTPSIALAAITCVVVLASASAERARPGSGIQRGRSGTSGSTSRLPCGNILGFQVLLDREGFSPGEIDAVEGANLQRALRAFQTERRLPETGVPDCETWQQLADDSPESTSTVYELTADDVKGPFTERIPSQLKRQNELSALEYRSPLERLAERFHAAPAPLREMNPGARWMVGESVTVPAVTPFDAAMKPQRDPTSDDVAILVSRDESALRATRADGSLVFFAPVSSGSLHDPLPPGEWKITGVAWRPVFH